MAIVWNESDERAIACLRELVKKEGNCLMVSDGAKGFMKFEVLDYYKANSFLMDVTDLPESTNITDITGIKVTEIGYLDGMSSDKIDKIQDHLNAIYDIIHDRKN